ncbi:glutamate ABC transporter substrate-binding protein [Demequina flava]|uniref:glutamate ABC transporter substrate-binding protein n=1 Tax=Demequina flava TaxID=1095025 RepID=UPI000784107D|nr:glutamate ABC transporter substrate-binding protein [Demequina flava]
MRTVVRGGVIAGAIALVAALSACSADEYPSDSTMSSLAESGEITIGVKHDQPLFGELDSEGVPQGFDVEVARIVADALDIDESGITWVEAPSDERENLLVNGKVDLIVATYTISEERKEKVGFAGPYYVAGQTLMTRKDDVDIASPLDLDGKQVCTVAGSTAAVTIGRVAPDASVVLFDDYSDCLEPLRTGQVDVVTTDDVILAGYADESDGQFRIVGAPFTAEPYGIGVAHDDDEFRAWINDTLEASMEDGSWQDAWDSTAGTVLPEPQRPHLDRYEASAEGDSDS